MNERPRLTRRDLLSIEKPARYLGGEWNQARPKPAARFSVCLAYPDLYELGMSNLALKILYDRLDRDPHVAVERVFAPWVDFAALMQKRGWPLFSLESHRPVRDFDLLGITLPYEMTFTNVLHLLDLAGLPKLAVERSTGPWVIAGGPSASNPAPVTAFFDAILIGDGEDALPELVAVLRRAKDENWDRPRTRTAMAEVRGFHIPGHPGPTKKRVFHGFPNEAPPVHNLVPHIEIVHDRAPLELMRGCVAGCRFCHAGYFYRPKRERTPDDLLKWSAELMRTSGDETLGLISLSTSDHSCLPEILQRLGANPVFPEQIIAVPSLRMDDKTLELLSGETAVKIAGLTFAPEAGSQRLRDIIGKNITEAEILSVIDRSRGSQYQTVKLYFMIGLPFETDDDLRALCDLVHRIEAACRRGGRRKSLSISISAFVPKPFTPFQWAAQPPVDELIRRRQLVCQGLVRSRAKLSWRDERVCRLEAVLSRGDAAVGRAVLRASELGCRFDGWSDQINLAAWDQALSETGVDANRYTRAWGLDEPLPWDDIDLLVPREFLVAEWKRAEALASNPVAVVQAESGTATSGKEVNTPSLQNPSVCTPEGATPAASPPTTATTPTPATPDATGPRGSSARVPCESAAVAPTVAQFRVTYSRRGPAVYLSHLDTLRVLARAVRRSGLPYAVSAGMHQRPRLSFGPPLPLGHASLCESMDLSLTQAIAAETVRERLAAEMPIGFAILGFEPLTPNRKPVQAEASGVVYFLGFADPEACAQARAFFTDPARLIKMRKGEKEVELPLAKAVLWVNDTDPAATPAVNTGDPGWVLQPAPLHAALEVAFNQGQPGVPAVGKIFATLFELFGATAPAEPEVVERIRIITNDAKN